MGGCWIAVLGTPSSNSDSELSCHQNTQIAQTLEFANSSSSRYGIYRCRVYIRKFASLDRHTLSLDGNLGGKGTSDDIQNQARRKKCRGQDEVNL